jgi:hypothetical protein
VIVGDGATVVVVGATVVVVDATVVDDELVVAGTGLGFDADGGCLCALADAAANPMTTTVETIAAPASVPRW